MDAYVVQVRAFRADPFRYMSGPIHLQMRYYSAKYDAVAKKAVYRNLDACLEDPKKNSNWYEKMSHKRREAHNCTKDNGRIVRMTCSWHACRAAPSQLSTECRISCLWQRHTLYIAVEMELLWHRSYCFVLS